MNSENSGLPTKIPRAELVEHYWSQGFWRDETLVDIAKRRVSEAPAKTLITEGNTSLSRETVWSQALQLSSFLRAKGLVAGDVISFQLPNWSESVVIALAARMLGLIINPIPAIYRESEVGYILNDCKSRIVFLPELFRGHNYRAMITRMRGDLPELVDVIFLRSNPKNANDWHQAISAPAMDVESLPKVNADSIMMIMYTSGTTGRPKGVLHTHCSYDYKTRQMGEFWKIDEADVIFMPSPVTHISGAFWTFDMPWVGGATTVLMDVWKPDEAVDYIGANHCTISGGATPFLQQLLNAAEEKSENLATLRMFFCGGTTVSSDLIKKAAAAFPHCLFFRAYGSTEMPTAAMGISDQAHAQQGAETDGEILVPTEIRIVDENGNGVPNGAEGEILARGPELFAGYLREEDNVSCFDTEGFFRTGDIGRLHQNKFLTITGRKKDIIIRSGENISPKEIEDLLLEHPAVDDVAIVAMPNQATGETGCAFLIPKSGYCIDLLDIQRYLTDQGLARQKFPEHLVLVDELPRVPSGKIKKDVLRARAREINQARDISQASELATAGEIR